MELLFTQEQYNNFINDSTDDIMKNIYFNDIFNYEERSYEVDYPKYINFCKTLEYYYFLFLKEQVFDLISDNSDDIYLKIRNKNDKIFLHANKIYDFYIPTGTSQPAKDASVKNRYHVRGFRFE